VLVMLAGCSWWEPREPVAARPTGTMTNVKDFASAHQSPALAGTIGSVSSLQGDRFMRVRGFGLVVGLDGKGSRNCLPSIREYLAREIRRARAPHTQHEFKLTPEELIDSPDTAVVEVVGEIPAGVAKGHVFDVVVSSASFDPDTQSLAGGYLLTCELKVFREVSPEEVIEGRPLARARGPVFINPFAGGEKSSAGVNPREGKVIGGAYSLEDRKLSLITAMESYSMVSRIQTAINRMFNCDPKAADGVSASMIELRVPPAYRGRERRFLEIVSHLSLEPSAAAREARGKELIAELVRPDAPLEDVALSLEGLGPPALGMVKTYYTHKRREVNFYAARTGLRLGDALAVEVIAHHARDARSPFRAAAIRELGECGNPVRAGLLLRELINEGDPRVQIMAYEALRRVDPEAVVTRTVGRDPENFLLDLVPCDGPMLIYARRTQTRRIALIGGDRLVLHPPLLYAEEGKPVLLSAAQNDQFVSLLKKDSRGRVLGEPLRLGTALPGFVYFLGHDPVQDAEGRLQGLGFDYAVVLDVLDRLCRSGAINAEFRWEEPGVEDLLGPLKPPGRPESEL
jgi:flagellar basal body P-ring protein FlgI